MFPNDLSPVTTEPAQATHRRGDRCSPDRGAGLVWNWPRGDARFVGRWKRVRGRVTAPEALLTNLELNANGTGRCVGVGPAETVEFRFPWRAEGNTVILGRVRGGWIATLLDELDRLTFTRLGYQQLPVVWRFPVRDVRQEELRLENDRYPEDRVFRRLGQ